MPKKLTGEGKKVTTRKVKESKVKNGPSLKKEVKHEDQEWIDSCKAIEKKLKQGVDKEVKRQDQLKRKNELKKLLKKDSPFSNKPKSKVPGKLTLDDVKKKLALDKVEKNIANINKSPSNNLLIEHLNRLTIGQEIARTIDEALSLLHEEESPKHKLPEKRVNAGYKTFEEKRIKELKTVHPTLKLSQLKDVIFKEWQKKHQKL